MPEGVFAIVGALDDLHFLRPAWLLALLLLPGLYAWWRARRRRQGEWRSVVDAHLLPHLLEAGGSARARMGVFLAALAWTLAVLALAGPSWRQSTQPLWRSQTPLVIALDLSSAVMASDLPPSRLARARAKLAGLLDQRSGGSVALVVFAGDAFTVAPLTDDAANVALFLDALRPDVMPVDGHRVDRAIAWSSELLRRAGAPRGDILVLTDAADGKAIEAAAKAAHAGHRVSVLGLGSENGGAYARADGSLGQARLDAASLRRLAARGDGDYAPVSLDDADLRSLDLLDASSAAVSGERSSATTWRDEGYWLLPPLMLLALFAFRRRGGALAVVLAVVLWPGLDAHAADLWRRPDQASHARIEDGNAAYRTGDYPRAASLYAEADSADAHYNRGNALAKAGRYEQALRAYDEALRRQPRMPDALANRRAVEAAMKRRPPEGGQSSPAPSSPSDGQQGQGGDPGESEAPPRQAQSGGGSPSQSARKPTPRKPDPGQAGKESGAGSPPEPADAERQRAADRAQRERMRQALQQARERGEGDPSSQENRRSETPEQRERRLANDAWLRRVPDDPGGLLRAKFRLEHERRQLQGRADE